MNFSFGAEPPDDGPPPPSKIPLNYPTDFAEFENMLYDQRLKLEQTEIELKQTKRMLKDEKLKVRELTNDNEILRRTIEKYTAPTPYNSVKVSFL
jgi:hypothetical protein